VPRTLTKRGGSPYFLAQEQSWRIAWRSLAAESDESEQRPARDAGRDRLLLSKRRDRLPRAHSCSGRGPGARSRGRLTLASTDRAGLTSASAETTVARPSGASPVCRLRPRVSGEERATWLAAWQGFDVRAMDFDRGDRRRVASTWQGECREPLTGRAGGR
jgi:hypothetical protein